jgi:hypothetical protein
VPPDPVTQPLHQRLELDPHGGLHPPTRRKRARSRASMYTRPGTACGARVRKAWLVKNSLS